jgi:hypothetical protein
MNRDTDPLLPRQLERLGLSDDERMFAASYLQGAESLAVLRCRIVAGTAILMTGCYTFTHLLGNEKPAIGNVRSLCDVVGNVAPIMFLVTLLFSLMAGGFLNRQLNAAALPAEARTALRTLASRMETYVVARFLRRAAGWLRVG